MSEEVSTQQKWLNALCVPLLLLPVDLFLLYLQPHSFAISHFSFAVLTAQALLLVVFAKGKICPGQRERLVDTNKGLGLFWGVWFLLSAFSSYHYLKTDLVAFCSIGAVIATSLQGKKPQENRPFLVSAGFMLALGVIAQSLSVWDIGFVQLFPFNPLAQMVLGVLISYLLLQLSKNRLHNFMQLLPMATLLLLFLNALTSFGLLWGMGNLGFAFANEMAIVVYFVMHLVLLLLLAKAQLMPSSLSVLSVLPLILLVFITESLPVWASFSYFN